MSASSDWVLFEAWLKKRDKHYKDDAVKEMRFNVFQCNLRQLEVESDERGVELECLSGFMDITDEEFHRDFGGGVEDSDDSDDETFTKTVTDKGLIVYSLRGHENEDTEDELMETSTEEKLEDGRYSCDEKYTKEEEKEQDATMSHEDVLNFVLR